MRKNQKLIFCALFAALMSAGAFIRLPGPIVPLTLQSFFALLAGLLLPPGAAFLSMLLYMLLGLLGLPVFAGGGGLSYLLQPSFGFIPGFALSAYLVAQLRARAKKNTVLSLFSFSLVGLLTLYAAGLFYLVFLFSFFFIAAWPENAAYFLYACLLLPLPGDLMCAFLASLCAKRLLPALKQMRAFVAK